MLYQVYINTFLSTAQTLLQYYFTSSTQIEPAKYTLSTPSTELQVIKLGLHPSIATEFGVRANTLLRSKHCHHPHHEKIHIGKETIASLQDEEEDKLICSSTIIRNTALMSVKALDQARHAFCNAVNGNTVPIGHAFSMMVEGLVSREGKDAHVVGIVDNMDGISRPGDGSLDWYVVSADECFKNTQIFVSKEERNCQKDGFSQGGVYLRGGTGISFTLYPVNDRALLNA